MKKVLICGITMLSLFVTGCTTYSPGKLPSAFIENDPKAVNKNNVYVITKIIDCKEVLAIFDCEVCEKGIQPFFIAINNKSDNTYAFEKTRVTPGYVEAKKVGIKCARSWLIGAGIWPPALVRNHKINVEIQDDYSNKEIKDASVKPREDLSGVLFVNQMKKGEKVVIPLINRNTGESLIFEFKGE